MLPWASSRAHPAASKWRGQLGPSPSPVTSVHLTTASSTRRPIHPLALLSLFILILILMQVAWASSMASFTGGQASPLTQDSIVIDDGASVATSTASMDDGWFTIVDLLLLPFSSSTRFTLLLSSSFSPTRTHQCSNFQRA